MESLRSKPYQVVFRSYTGPFVHFYVNKTSGTTKMVEKVPNLNVEEDDGETIKTHPLVPKDIVVRGFIIDSETGALEEIQWGR